MESQLFNAPPERPAGAPRTLSNLFRQDVWWKQASGEWIKVAEMSDKHRLNTARFLLRNASKYAQIIGFSELGQMYDAPEEVVDSWLAEDARRMLAPESWITGTRLYAAMRKGHQVNANMDDITRDLLGAFFGKESGR